MHYSILKNLLAIVLCGAIVILQPACQRERSNKPEGRRQSPPTAVNRDIPLTNENAYDTVLKKLQKDPNNIEAIYHLGDLYYRDGLYEKAVENFRRVVSAEPNRGYVFLKLGTSLSRLQRYEEALDAFTQAVANLKDPTFAYNNMGIVYGKLGRYEEEIAALQKAIKHRPRYAAARYNLGVTFIKVGNLDGARQQYLALNEFDLTMAQALLDQINKAAPGENKRSQ